MLPPLPYFKVNICPFPLPHFASYFSLICDPFADPIIPLHSRDITLYDCHIYIYLPGPPQTNWTRISVKVACFIFKTLKGYSHFRSGVTGNLFQPARYPGRNTQTRLKGPVGMNSLG